MSTSSATRASPPVPVGVAALGIVGGVLAVAGGSIAQRLGGLPAWWPWEQQVVEHAAEASVSALLLPVATFFVGLLLVVVAWLRLVRFTRDASPAVGVVLAIVGLWAVPFLLGPPLASLDVYSYAAVGELATAGADPYEVPPSSLPDGAVTRYVDPLWAQTPTPYGPAFTLVARAVVEVVDTDDVTGVVIGFRLAAVVGLAALAAGLVALSRRTGHDPAVAVAVVLGSPVVLLHVVSGMHNEALMVGTMVAGIAICAGRPQGPGTAVLDGAWIVGVALIALGAAVKLPALLALGFVVAWRMDGWAPRRLLTVGGTAAATGILVLGTTSLLAGHGLGWLRTLTGGTDVFSYLSVTSLLGAPVDVLETPFRVAGLLIASILTAKWLHDAVAGERVDPGRAGASLLAIGLLGPVVHPHYLLWGTPLLAAAPTGARLGWVVAPMTAVTFLVLPAPVGPELAAVLPW